MLHAFTITLREGLEAVLIIAISLSYLRRSGNQHLVPAVHWGIVVSVVMSVAPGVAFARAANQALWEGVLAIAAAVLVASLIVHMWRAGSRMKREIEENLNERITDVEKKISKDIRDLKTILSEIRDKLKDKETEIEPQLS